MSEHWLQHAHGRIVAGDDELDVLADYGWVQITDAERDALEFAVETGRVATHDTAILRTLLDSHTTGTDEMTDIIDRLRTWCHAPNAASAQDLMDEAADEIRRLRSSMAEQQFCKLPVAGSSPAVGFLTAEEREAFAWGLNWLAARFCMDHNPAAHQDIKTLQKLFARLDVTKPMPIETSAEVSSHPKSDRIYVSSQDASD